MSAVSVWEIVIEAQRGKLQVPQDWAVGIKEQDFQILPFEAQHALAVSSLPLHHQEPVDLARLAQASSEKLRLVTADADMKRYARRSTCSDADYEPKNGMGFDPSAQREVRQRPAGAVVGIAKAVDAVPEAVGD